MKVMDTAWRSYAEQVLPIDAPDVQRQECRRAFYAGGQACLGGIMNMLDPGVDPTEADLDKMTALQGELEQFAADVAARRA